MRKRQLVFSVTMAILLLLAMLMGSLPGSIPAVAQGEMSTASAPPHITAVPPDVPLSSLNVSPGTEASTSLHQVTPGNSTIPSAQSGIDVRPLLAKWRAAGSPINQPVFDDAAMARIAAQAPAVLATTDSFGSGGEPNYDPANVGTAESPRAAPDGTQAKLVPSAVSPTASASRTTVDPRITAYGQNLVPAQTSPPQNCTQVLSDTAYINPTSTPPYWPVYDQIVYYSPDQYTSAPYAWYMAENELGVYDGAAEDADMVRDTRPGRNTDIDSFGQPFDVPTNAVSLNGTLNFQYVIGTTVPGDRLYVEIYAAGSSGGATSYGNYIDGTYFDVGSLDDGQWKTFNWSITNETTLATMRGQRVVLRISTWNNNNSISTKVYIDDITANICQPIIVGGYVTQRGNGGASSTTMSNAILLLTVNSATDQKILSLVTPRSDGLYAFGGLPALPANQYYQVIYFNYNADATPLDDTRLSLLYGPSTSGAIGASDLVVMPTFDISNVILSQPGPDATVVAPATQVVSFTWQTRSLPASYATEYFQQCIYDPQTVQPGTSNPITLCTEPLGDNSGETPNLTRVKAGNKKNGGSFPDNYPFTYGQRYTWYVKACTVAVDLNGDGRGDWCGGQVGYSFYEHVVTFAENVTPLPSSPKQPSGSLPTSASKRAWTVMIYFGGDNSLGDANRTPNSIANLQSQFETLKKTAPQVAAAHVVALGDFYGDTGTQVCYLSDPSGPQCEELGEQNSADPALLTKFINQGLSYPSNYTMLVIASHGHAVVGVGMDETSRDKITGVAPKMAPNQIVEALTAAGLNTPTRKLDVIFFNACLMATTETAVMMAPFADYLVASADTIWVLFFYDRIFALLGGSPRDVASGILDAYNAALNNVKPDSYRTLIALDLSKIAAVNTALNGLGDALRANQDKVPTEIANQRKTVQVYDSSGNDMLDQILDNTGQPSPVEEDALVDIGHLATLLSSTSNSAIASAANNLVSILSGGLVVKSLVQSGGSNYQNVRHDYVANAVGLGLYFSNGLLVSNQQELNDLYLHDGNMKPFNNTSTWDDFLTTYVYSGLPTGAGTVGRKSVDPVGGMIPPAMSTATPTPTPTATGTQTITPTAAIGTPTATNTPIATDTPTATKTTSGSETIISRIYLPMITGAKSPITPAQSHAPTYRNQTFR